MNYWLEKQIQAQRAEHEAFHAMLELVPSQLKSEAINLWVKGTRASADEARALTMQLETLSKNEVKKNQNLAHEAWVTMMDFASLKN